MINKINWEFGFDEYLEDNYDEKTGMVISITTNPVIITYPLRLNDEFSDYYVMIEVYL